MKGKRTSIVFHIRRKLKDWRWRRRICARQEIGAGSLVDREARDHFAQLLRALVLGEITNDDYENNVPVLSCDPAVAAIDRAVWELYPDMRKCKLTGKNALDEETVAAAESWSLFLLSDLEYRWPLEDPAPWLSRIAKLLGNWSVEAQPQRTDGENVWPFFTLAELQDEVERVEGAD